MGVLLEFPLNLSDQVFALFINRRAAMRCIVTRELREVLKEVAKNSVCRIEEVECRLLRFSMLNFIF